MDLLVFLLTCYGVTNIVTASRLFLGIRGWLAARSEPAGYWIRCPMCFGVPVGIATWLLGLRPMPPIGVLGELVVAGAISSAGCWIGYVILNRLGAGDL